MSLYENETIEFKREYVDDIKKTIVAFANTSGGTLYIGMENDGTPIGLTNIDEIMLRLSNSFRDAIKPDITLFVKYHTEEISGKTIIKVSVQKGTASPYYLANKGIRPEGVYVRQGASTVPANEAVILKMIRETDGEKYEEVRSLNQDLTFFEAEKEFKKRDVNFEQNNKKTLKLMNSDGIYTNLGLLISDQCVHTVKIAVFEDTVKAIFKDRYEFNGSLLKQLNEAYQFIDRYNRTHSEITGLHRIDTRDYPIEAIRESLLNAIVHRDYSFSAGILISIFDDRIEFVSIGGLVKGITYDDIMLGVSVPRNENLANVFYRLTLIEAYGTGIPKILRSYKRYSVKPQIEVSDNAFKITLPNVNANFALVKSKELLSDNEHGVLQMFEKQEYITRKEVEKILAISQAMAVRVLKQLSDKNLIQVNGKGKNTRYSLWDKNGNLS
jgi:ATP-dependent DNA helicase RecG